MSAGNVFFVYWTVVWFLRDVCSHTGVCVCMCILFTEAFGLVISRMHFSNMLRLSGRITHFIMVLYCSVRTGMTAAVSCFTACCILSFCWFSLCISVVNVFAVFYLSCVCNVGSYLTHWLPRFCIRYCQLSSSSLTMDNCFYSYFYKAFLKHSSTAILALQILMIYIILSSHISMKESTNFQYGSISTKWIGQIHFNLVAILLVSTSITQSHLSCLCQPLGIPH